MGVARCYGDSARDSCAQVRFTGASAFHRRGEPDITFVIQTYEDESSAESAYGTVWKAWKHRVPQSRPVHTGRLGEQSDAVVGLNAAMAEGSKGLLVQVRVGSVILLSMAEAGAHVDVPDSYLRRFAGGFAQRAVEAQDGKTPSAGPAGG